MITPIVPIKVKIGLRPNGHADHPAWELLPLIDTCFRQNPDGPVMMSIEKSENTPWVHGTMTNLLATK